MDEGEGIENLLIAEKDYLLSGVHIGTQKKNADMKRFIYRVREDGLFVLDIRQTDQKIRSSGSLLAKFKPEEILAVGIRQYAKTPLEQIKKLLGIKVISSRFMPGTLTNPHSEGYLEPSIIIITDPAVDGQALKEAAENGIPIVALCDANNETKNIDLVIPTNNKGRKSLALVYWLLAREILKQRGEIKTYEEFKVSPEEFETEI
jgi:small subunit ribosomal protein S2